MGLVADKLSSRLRVDMAKQYEKKPIKSQQGRGLSALWLGFVTFVFGYLASSWLDVNQFGCWVNSFIHPAQIQKNAEQSQVDASLPPRPKLEFYTLLTNEPVSKSAIEAKPTDVTLENNAKVEVPTSDLASTSQPLDLEVRPAAGVASNVAATITPAGQTQPPPSRLIESSKPNLATPVAKSEGSYVIQVGSFRALREAQRMKAHLLMKGFSADITTVMQQDTYWYRVHIGPFTSLTQAQQTQQSFARTERITGMIRKLT